MKLIRRHESLRTSFIMLNGIPRQIIHEDVVFSLACEECAEEKANGMVESFISPFDLSRAPLFRVGLMKIGQEQYLLLVDMHHIISDGVSQEILVKDFKTLSSGKTLLPLNIQYNMNKFDLIFNFSESDERISLALHYNRDLFKQERMERLLIHFTQYTI